jgi:hypothetical protein
LLNLGFQALTLRAYPRIANIHRAWSAVEEYLVQAARCIKIVQETDDMASKLSLLDLARGWLGMAEQQCIRLVILLPADKLAKSSLLVRGANV